MIALGPACAFGSSVTWAVGSVFYSRLSRSHSSFAVNFTRAMVAFPLFVIAAIVSGADPSSLSWTRIQWFTLSTIASYALGDALFLMSSTSIGVPAALAIASCYPVWTAIAGWAYDGEVLSASQIAGLMIAVAGIITVILSSGKDEERGTGSRARGVLLALATSFFWTINSFATAKGGRDLNPALGNCVRMGAALILIAVFSRLFMKDRSLFIPWNRFRSLSAVFVFEAFGGSLLFLYGLSHSPLALGSTLSSLAPVLSVPVAIGLGLEKPSLFRILGVLGTVLGVCLLVGGITIL